MNERVMNKHDKWIAKNLDWSIRDHSIMPDKIIPTPKRDMERIKPREKKIKQPKQDIIYKKLDEVWNPLKDWRPHAKQNIQSRDDTNTPAKSTHQ
jgi:hypothetical protein